MRHNYVTEKEKALPHPCHLTRIIGQAGDHYRKYIHTTTCSCYSYAWENIHHEHSCHWISIAGLSNTTVLSANPPYAWVNIYGHHVEFDNTGISNESKR